MHARLAALAACFVAFASLAAPAADLPGLAVPEGLGVNIHFTDPRPGEMEMLAAAGFRFIRMDFSWGGTEREQGKYDFSAYERLLTALDAQKIRALFILDYSNRHYDDNQSPRSDAGRQAFARWAATAARHFRGRGIVWEMYNEPNIRFWRPEPNVEDYVKLALAVGKAIRAAAPGELYIGPGTSQIDFAFIERCCQAGVLKYWDAVSVHPYRQTAPETVTPEYARLRQMIDRYAPPGRQIPIISGEWGYSAAWNNFDPLKQGKLLPRQWLTNLAYDVPVSIWYDWHDDGPDPQEAEHHFGTVLHPYQAGRAPVYEPKPAYLAARTLTSQLAGFRFNKRLDLGNADDYAFLFAKGDEVCLVAWTAALEPHEALLPASHGRFHVTGHTGENLPDLSADAKGLAVKLTGAPQYLVPDAANELLRVAAAWQRAPIAVTLRAQHNATATLTLRNPLARAIRASSDGGPAIEVPPGATAKLTTRFDLPRTSTPVDIRLECRIEGLGLVAQTTAVTASNPVTLTLGPLVGKELAIRVENPSGEALRGVVRLTAAANPAPLESADLLLREGQKETEVVFPWKSRTRQFQFGVRVEEGDAGAVFELPVTTYTLVDNFAQPEGDIRAGYQLIPDGDAKIASEQSFALVDAPPGLPGQGVKALKLSYRMDEGWKFIRLARKGDAFQKIEGRPRALGLWLHGDGSGNSPRLRVVDSTGQVHQPTGPAITWTGWRYIELPLDGSQSGHWGGADDGKVHYPIRFDTLFLLDGNRKATAGEIHFAVPVLIQ